MFSTRTSVDTQASQRSQIPGSFPSSPPLSPRQNLQRNLTREVFDRQAEYVKIQRLKLKIGSWNVAACPGTEKDIRGWFAQGKGVLRTLAGLSRSGSKSSKHQEDEVEGVIPQEERFSNKKPSIPQQDTQQLPGEDEIDIYALGLQEIVDINSATEALRPYSDPNPAKKWKDAVSEALPSGYVLIAEQQLIGLLLLIYAKPDIATTISSISTSSVGTGLMGYMGNKGAVSARIVLGETTKMVFVNSHLAAGHDKASLERRNWDAAEIVRRTRFTPVDHGHGLVEGSGDRLGDEDFTFWFGDLNYRLKDIPGDDVRRLLLIHTRNEYDANEASKVSIDKELNIKESSPEIAPNHNYDEEDVEDLDPSQDPASVQTAISSLIVHDQLHEQMRLKKAFHEGWQEGEIKFLPTYKYDVGSVGMFDSSEKKRGPSWCDRILFRTKKHYNEYMREKQEHEFVKKRDQEMKARGLEKEDDVMFDYDPETDGAQGLDGNEDGYEEYHEDTNDDTKEPEGSEIKLMLEYYTSHQRVLSSDHKPLVAVFNVEYKAADQTRKAEIYQEVAKELDRDENEGKPSVTVVFESRELHEKADGCHFGEIRFLEEKSVIFTIANTSPIPTTLEFVDRNIDGAIPTWLQIISHDSPARVQHGRAPKSITLQPGDSTNLEAIAIVAEEKDLCSFNEGTSKPEDILILRVRNGRDHFIPVQAQWQKSCFGLSIDKLVRLPKEGARKHSLGSALEKEDAKGSAPRELFRLTEALEENLSKIMVDEESKHSSRINRAGWPFLEKQMLDQISRDSRLLTIREALDTGNPIVFTDNISYIEKTELLAQTTMLFLAHMPGRIISNSLWTTVSDSLSEHEWSKKPPLQGEDLRSHILDLLSVSPTRSVSFTFITFMLSRIVAELAPLGEQSDSLVPPMTPVTPKTPDALLKRARGLSLNSDPRLLRRREVQAIFVDTFIPLIFEADPSIRLGTKARKLEVDRKRAVLGVFIRSREEDSL
jgi:inositol polyphosphate 5-phosphatase INPP5B/F